MRKKNTDLLYSSLFVLILILVLQSCKKEEEFNVPFTQVVDADSNVYNVVIIGNQAWLKENLRTTRYNDNTAIPEISDAVVWANLSTPGRCTYNNTINQDTIVEYGRFYNWYAVNSGKLCPKGWHVPSYDEWSALINNLGGENIAGGKLKEMGLEHWVSPNTDADNSSGFNAIPGGVRLSNGNFFDIGYSSNWWSSTKYVFDEELINIVYLHNLYGSVSRGVVDKKYGLCVRCLLD